MNLTTVNYEPPGMVIHLCTAPVEGLYINPVNKRLKRFYQNLIIKNHRQSCPNMHTWQKEDTEGWLRSSATIYIQSDLQIEEFCRHLSMSKTEMKDIDKGWGMKGWGMNKMISIEDFEHFFEVYNEIQI